MAATAIFSHYLVINSLPLGIAACYIDPEDLGPLADDPSLIGENVHLPGTDGRTAYDKDKDELPVSFPVNLNGRYKFTDDTWNSDPAAGLIVNRDYLRANIGTRGSIVTCVEHKPGGATASTNVQLVGLSGWKKSGIFMLGRLDLLVPASAFT